MSPGPSMGKAGNKGGSSVESLMEGRGSLRRIPSTPFAPYATAHLGSQGSCYFFLIVGYRNLKVLIQPFS